MTETATVFVVDDDEPVRDAIGMLLDTVGLPFKSFGSGQEFLEAFQPGLVGCVVLDIRMPGISGLDVQERMIGFAVCWGLGVLLEFAAFACLGHHRKYLHSVAGSLKVETLGPGLEFH